MGSRSVGCRDKVSGVAVRLLGVGLGKECSAYPKLELYMMLLSVSWLKAR